MSSIQFSTAGSGRQDTHQVSRWLRLYLLVFFVCWVTTFIYTTDRANWFTENALTVAVLLTLGFSYRKFRFSDLSYTFFFLFALMHIYGAEYTYAENPFGYWLKDLLHLQRNHYDRLVHFGFGLLLAYPLREYFMNWFKWPAWVCNTLPVEITLSFSAAYELVEWAVAEVFFPSEGIAYLGTQGDVWDAQKDMGLALGGSVLAMLLVFLSGRFFKK